MNLDYTTSSPNRNRRLLALTTILVVAVVFFLTVGTVGAQSGTEDGAITHEEQDIDRKAPPEQKETNISDKNIDPLLVRFISESDRDTFAERNGIEYRDGSVQVVIEIESGATLPGNYNITNKMSYTGQGENLAQVYIPVDELRPMSNESVVERVRLPQRGTPDQETEDQTSDGEADDLERNETGESGGGENATQEDKDQTESDTEDPEDLSSVAGSLLATLVIILTAAYGRRKL